MKETNLFEDMNKQEKPHMLPKTLFCENCGITETSPSFGQQYCRYCGTKFKNKLWLYEKGDEEKVLDKIDEIITDALDKSTDQKESQTLRWVLDKISEVIEDGDNT